MEASIQQNYQQDYKQDYGEPFETAIIIAMSALIVLSFLAVAWLWHTYSPSCKVMEYTYCPEENASSSQDHH